MPATAYQWFIEDIIRAEQLTALVSNNVVPATGYDQVRADLLRCSLMYAVGALDSYLSKAYVDIVASALRASSLEPTTPIPEALYEITIPAGAAMRDYDHRPNWRWRMAAKHYMSDKNMLNLGGIADRFNPLFPSDSKLYHSVVVDWAEKPEANKRLFGISREEFSVLSTADKVARKDRLVDALKTRFKKIIQRRHDCIHTCDRPKQKPQGLRSPGTIANVIRDIRFFAASMDEHIDNGFADTLVEMGYSANTRHLVGYPDGA